MTIKNLNFFKEYSCCEATISKNYFGADKYCISAFNHSYSLTFSKKLDRP